MCALIVKSGCGLLLSFCPIHHRHLVSSRCLNFLVPPGRLDDGILSWICLWAGLRACRFGTTPVSDLPYLNGYWGFRLGPIPGFCRLKTTGRWSLPCDARVSARVYGASFGNISARSIVLSVSHCRVPGCVGLALDTGVKRTSQSVAYSAHFAGCCHIDPTGLTVHWNHYIPELCLRSSQFVFHLLKEIPTCSCGEGGWVDVCIDENQWFVSRLVFLSGCPTIRMSLWTTNPS